MACRPETTPRDLAAILEFLNGIGVRAWVHGGWALDALSGSTRPHKDIDLLVEEKHREPLRSALAGRIIAEMSHKFEVDFDGAEIDLMFFSRTWRGRLVSRAPRILIEWTPAAFGDRTAAVGDVTIPVVEPSVLYVEVADPAGKKREMLDKNQLDLERVTALLTPEEREAARRYYPVRNTLSNRLKLAFGLR
jgi:hypothetical protein